MVVTTNYSIDRPEREREQDGANCNRYGRESKGKQHKYGIITDPGIFVKICLE